MAKAIEKNSPEITEEYMREHGLVAMDYYNERVIANRSQIIDFCLEGIGCCEGPEKARLQNILGDAMRGRLFCCDWYDMVDSDPYEGRRKLVDFEVFEHENDAILQTMGALEW